MVLRDETVERVLAFWRAWVVNNDTPNAVSVVTIGDERLIRAPEWLRPRLDVDSLPDLRSLVGALGDDVEEVVGEARLAYADDGTLQLVATDDVIVIADHDPDFAALDAAADQHEWREASADEPCDRRFGVAREGSLLAVSTLRVWEGTLGHVGVFTAAHARGRGLASQAGSAAVNDARARGLVPQWRSRIGNDASARVADKLGFVALGRQAFVRVRAPL